MGAAVVALSVIAARSAAVFQTIRLLGAAYLVHLGARRRRSSSSASCRSSCTADPRRPGRSSSRAPWTSIAVGGGVAASA
ncbi:hypothetical protein [Streptomyces sp. NPDC016845]|uniref:hypothetical protein n=1 Tax=Streptomyces sp. NPDC016845 TaxID=3364972 RepID=UPI00378F2D93